MPRHVCVGLVGFGWGWVGVWFGPRCWFRLGWEVAALGGAGWVVGAAGLARVAAVSFVLVGGGGGEPWARGWWVLGWAGSGSRWASATDKGS